MIPFRIMNGTIVKNCGKKNKPRDYYTQTQLVCAHMTVAGNPDLFVNSSALPISNIKLLIWFERLLIPHQDPNTFEGSESQEKKKLSTRHTLLCLYPTAPYVNSCAGLLQLPLFYFKIIIIIIIVRVSEILPENLLCI